MIATRIALTIVSVATLALAGNAVVDRDDAAAIHTPWNLVLLLARGDAGVALDATLGIAQEFHSGHVEFLRFTP